MLLRQTMLFLPAQVIGPLAQMVAAIVWTYFLVPEALGVYAIVWAVQELAGVVVLAWWSGYVLRYASSHHDTKARARLDAMEGVVQSVSAVVETLIAVGAVWLVIDIEPTFNLLAAAVAFTLTRNISSHFADRARARFETVPYTILQTVGSLFGLVFGIVAVSTIAATPEALLWSYAIAQAIGLAAALPLMTFHLGAPRTDRALLRAALWYGAPLFVSSVLVWVATHAIRFLVQADLGIEAVGFITVGWWLGMRLTTFASLLVTGASFSIAVEKMRGGGAAAALPQLATNGALLLAILVPSVAGVIVLNEAFVTALVAPIYVEVTMAILPWAVATGAIRAFKNHGSDQCFLLFERTTLNIWSTVVEAGLTVVLCWAGLQWNGLTGAVIGCFAAAVIAELFSLAVARGLFGYYLRLADLMRIALATAVMVGVLIVLPLAHTIPGLLLEVLAGALTYGAVIALCFPDSQAWLRGRVGRLAER